MRAAPSKSGAASKTTTTLTTNKRASSVGQNDCKKVVNLSSHAASSLCAPQIPNSQLANGAQERSTVKSIVASNVVGQLFAKHPDKPMRFVGIDLGSKLSFCEVDGDKVVHRETLTNPDQLQRLLGPHTPPAVVAIEACREVWHYHDLLQSFGHRVLVVDTTRVRELGIGHGRRKNDRIDAEVLARAAQSGRIPLAHVLSPARRLLRAKIGVRRALVQTRADYVVTVRGLLRSWGVRMPGCDAKDFVPNINKLVRRKQLSKERFKEIAPLIAILDSLEPQIETLDEELTATIEDIDIGKLLMTCPGVGVVVACSFVSVIDDASRFQTAHQVEAYLGLVPSENTSGRRKLGSITKAGNSYLRSLLVQASWSLLRARGNSALKVWGLALAKRKSKRVAVVAVARRLAGILWAMWRDGSAYNPEQLGKASSQGLHKQANQVQATAHAVRATC
jgi:transposase